MSAAPTSARDTAPLPALWHAALARPLHGAACGCSAMASVRIDAVTLELDLLDHIETRHRLHGLQVWQAALAQRRAAVVVGSFPVWVESLRGVQLDAELHDLVVSVIRTTLLSIAEHAAGRLAPASMLNSGWLMKQTTG